MSDGREPDVRASERGALANRVGPMFWVALVLPLAGYLTFIGLVEAKRWGSPAIEVRIEGYDPRDPLRGQYLNYRLDLEGDDQRRSGRFACAGPSVDGLNSVHLFDGERPVACVHELPADFVQGNHRFYVQQDRGQQLEQAVLQGKASVVLRVVSDSQIVVDELRVEGQSIR